jgi:hypothetical protein
MVTNELTVRRRAYAAATAVGEDPAPLVRSCAAEADCWEEPRLCSLSTAFRAVGCSRTRRCVPREASLSIRTAFDPLQFMVEPLHHPVVPRFGTRVGDCQGIIGQAIHKVDQFLNSRDAHSRFPLFQPALPLPLTQQVAKVLRQPIDSCDCATADASQPRNLLFGMTSVEQFPDELVPHNAGGMIVLTGLISLPG